MKKVYSKPEILFENFALSLNIANAGCEIRDPHHELLAFTGMGADGGVGYAFTNSCDVNMDNGSGDGEHNGICYHVFSSNGGMNFHAS